MNRLILTGHVDGDPQTFKIGDDKTKTSFRLAEVGGKGWHTVVVWNDDAPTPAKGDLVYVEGRSQTRSYDKDGTKMYVNECVANVCEVMSGTTAVADLDFGD